MRVNDNSANNGLQHLLSIEDLSVNSVREILVKARKFLHPDTHKIIKKDLLKEVTVANLFYEMSTRTRTTFEIAEKSLSADLLTLNISDSSVGKGESLDDTLLNLAAMGCEIFVIRQSEEGEIIRIAEEVLPHAAVINAGDGKRAHPTQALLDLYTIEHFKGDIKNLTIAIAGDIEHSRVARSQLALFQLMGVKQIHVIGPVELVPDSLQTDRVSVFREFEAGVKDVDVVITLRIQKERMSSVSIPHGDDYFNLYGLTQERLALAQPDAIVMHPGPMNREVEIASNVADGAQSVILDQVKFGIAVRMAILSMLTETLAKR